MDDGKCFFMIKNISKLISVGFLLLNLPIALPASFADFSSLSRFEKLSKLYQHWNITEPSPLGGNNVLHNVQTRQGFEEVLKYIDPNGDLAKYATWDDREVTLFHDRDTKIQPELTFSFKQTGDAVDVQGLVYTFQNATGLNATATPLKGLRVALDPGHMGGKEWDKITGKYVSVNGGYVSEGEIAYQTAVLLSQKLQSLGAQVIITRGEAAAATTVDLKTYNILDYAFTEIRSVSDDSWFDKLLGVKAADEDAFFKKADANAEILSRMGEQQRGDYFIFRADLQARIAAINAFQPHMTIVIHYDASKANSLQYATNAVKVYVPGNVMTGELAAKEDRQLILQHALEGARWNQSVRFSAAVAAKMSDTLKIPVDKNSVGYNAMKVTDGVFSRNLALTRDVIYGVQTYLECLNYDNAYEYARLAKKDKTGNFNGVDFQYSSRIDDVVEGITNGVLEYLWNL